MSQDLREDYENYLKYEQNFSALTVSAYTEDLKSYLESSSSFLGEELNPSEQDLDLVRRWLNGMMTKGDKASSVARRLASVKGFYKYLLKMGRISRNPIANLRPPRGEKPLPVYVPTNYINEILDEELEPYDWVALRNKLIVAVLYECGLRRSELAGLKDDDVDIEGRKLKVLGKGNKERIVPFGAGLADELSKWRQTRDELFGESETFFLSLRGKPMTGEGVYAIVHKYLKAVPGLARRGAHALRHSFATDMLNNGADLIAIKELMGHSNVSTTVTYTHTSFKQLQKVYNAHPRAKKK